MSSHAPLLALACLLLTAARAHAHPTPGSVAFVDFTVDGARLEHDVPIEELERALHVRLAEPGESAEHVVLRHSAMLFAYGAQHLRAAAAEGGAAWRVEVLDVSGHPADDGPRARFRFALHAAPGQASGSLRLHDELIAHEVVSHYTRVYVRSDWAAGQTEARPQLAGTIHAGHNDVTLVRGGSFWRGLGSVVALGTEHIATGTDHLLFLFALVLVAPLAAVGGTWSQRRSSRDALLSVARIVTAFTVGHSLTLAFGALGWVSLPAALVEAAIALSVLITAAHALRPIFPRRETLLAAAFGLVHGLAFASTLLGHDLGRAQALWTLLGFNTGIELAQLGLLCLILPWLLLLARTRAYDAFRPIGGSSAAVLALGWLIERTSTLPNPTAVPLAWLEAHPLLLLIGLALTTLIARIADGRAGSDGYIKRMWSGSSARSQDG